MCGADFDHAGETLPFEGSPPRVRSRRPAGDGGRRPPGITSACAEQTGLKSAWDGVTGDHLRVCGADSAGDGVGQLVPGITSACAEQTGLWRSNGCATWDHLRVCGADIIRTPHLHETRGSPPRVRSRLQPDRHRRLATGITSACAEQTTAAAAPTWPTGDHLRVCGADHGQTH